MLTYNKPFALLSDTKVREYSRILLEGITDNMSKDTLEGGNLNTLALHVRVVDWTVCPGKVNRLVVLFEPSTKRIQRGGVTYDIISLECDVTCETEIYDFEGDKEALMMKSEFLIYLQEHTSLLLLSCGLGDTALNAVLANFYSDGTILGLSASTVSVYMESIAYTLESVMNTGIGLNMVKLANVTGVPMVDESDWETPSQLRWGTCQHSFKVTTNDSVKLMQRLK